ncbi:1-aminocyclopropane-1-carboxylate deaminase/D-cysteine desulfhydrase [Acinetobacter sp. MD2(2019)]|uniref:1-aminocyclopropane-1-carboxylate deaminase/D-cysteine desulfhydrase n=1 Tax=Acinetobacter sp. MD2(2019) TaxID=2605273 RepID=UPI002D1F4694|nr:pyridoxal-phosphate dependent enzyme [Acinetobacter sp. MD2(2019)]MEB3754834.1 pyridoxal-phosphate dependent enzyme [Acinetobacter sp. MD2(2019)]
MSDLFAPSQIPHQTLIQNARIQLDLKRLDLVHPQISGNKFYKLKYNFQQAQQQQKIGVLTFGGAYSNHIAATAFAAHGLGLKSIAIIRGEELAHKKLNSTLSTAQQFGMQLHFVSRQHYQQRHEVEFLQTLARQYPDFLIIPEGGTNSLAIQGCKEILTPDDLSNYDQFCCAVGTGGTLAGLIESSLPTQQILGFSALKGDFLTHDVQQLTLKRNWQITDAYCCGGYAKTTPELMQFIQNFEAQYQIPLEQIYTAKMLMGLFDLIKKDYFASGTRILAIHTGGLQGRQI